MAVGAQDAADELDHIVMICGTNGDSRRERRYIESLLDRRVDGLLLVQSSLSAEELLPLAPQAPLIAVGRNNEISGSRVVHVD
jgi:DNA-binding LacI/PurR family transcriptional regulator